MKKQDEGEAKEGEGEAPKEGEGEAPKEDAAAAGGSVGPDAALAGRKTVPLEAQAISLTGWLRIGSEAFEDRSRFPNVPIVTGGVAGEFDAMMHALQQGGQKFKDSIGNLQFGKVDDVKFVDMFYVRLQNRTVWFSETTDSTMIEASINPTAATCSGEINSPGCFLLTDGNDKWMMCAEEQAEADNWCCKIKESLGGDKCPDLTEGVSIQQVEEVLQPLIIIPLPSPNCNTDWNYNEHGKDWQCRCPIGLEQSPIDLPNPYMQQFVRYNAEFKYETIPKAQIKVVYDLNMIRFQMNDPLTQTFGTIKDIDNTEYRATEIRIHTPADHTILGESFEMEVQIIHEATKGVMKNQAILSFLFDVVPGGINKQIGNWNVINMPNPEVTRVNQFFNEDFNVMSFIYDEIPEDFEPQFNYYKYMGSMTNPPCEENVVWFVYEKPLTIGTTAMDMIREALFIPGHSAIDKDANYDGNNRNIQKIKDRSVFFYDKKKDCQNPFVPDEAEDGGHWEKEVKKVDRYYYIGGPKPSNLPNSFVVSKDEAEIGVSNTTRGSDRYKLDKMD